MKYRCNIDEIFLLIQSGISLLIHFKGADAKVRIKSFRRRHFLGVDNYMKTIDFEIIFLRCYQYGYATRIKRKVRSIESTARMQIIGFATEMNSLLGK